MFLKRALRLCGNCEQRINFSFGAAERSSRRHVAGPEEAKDALYFGVYLGRSLDVAASLERPEGRRRERPSVVVRLSRLIFGGSVVAEVGLRLPRLRQRAMALLARTQERFASSVCFPPFAAPLPALSVHPPKAAVAVWQVHSIAVRDASVRSAFLTLSDRRTCQGVFWRVASNAICGERCFRSCLSQCRSFSKILRWQSDTPLARQLEGFVDGEAFLNACLSARKRMRKRDWLAALSLASTRRRLDLNSASFKAFVASALEEPQLTDAQTIHLTLHRLAVLGDGASLWRLEETLRHFIAERALTPRQIAVCAWACSKSGVSSSGLWSEFGKAALLGVCDFSLADVSMLAWSFAKVHRVKAQEVSALKSRSLDLLAKVVEAALQQKYKVINSSSVAASSEDKTALDEKRTSPSGHDICMLLTAFSELTPRDSTFAVRALFCLVLLCRTQTNATSKSALFLPHPSAPPRETTRIDEASMRKGEFEDLLSATSLTAQGLTGAWVALRRFKLCDAFSLPLHKTPDSRCRHASYRPFDSSEGREQPVSSSPLPALLSLLEEKQEETALGEESVAPVAYQAEKSFQQALSLLKSPSLLRRSSVLALLEALCEETRLIRLDHTVNSGAAASLAEAFAGMRLVDPRPLHFLSFFWTEKGATQSRATQVLQTAAAFEQLGLSEAKTWRRLNVFFGESPRPLRVRRLSSAVHRAQERCGDMSVKEIKKLLAVARRTGNSNDRLEGVSDHFLSLKEDIERHGPL